MSPTEPIPPEEEATPVPPGLVSVEEARIYLQVDAKDKPTDDLLEQIIDGLSLRVLQHTGRTYINSDSNDEPAERLFQFEPTDNGVTIDDCREPKDVQVTATPNEEGSWLTLGADLYVLEPLGSAVIDRIRFLDPGSLPAQGTGWGALGLHLGTAGGLGGGTPWPRQAARQVSAYATVRVSAKWGYGPDLTTVPANVKLAVLMWLQNIHKRDQAFFSESAKVTAKIAMPDDVRELLDGEASNRPMVSAV